MDTRDFEFLRVRFRFRAIDPLYFPPGKAGNVLRGTFGRVFRKVACLDSCTAAATCDIRATCPYARIFEPQALGDGPSGLNDWPRPFVFRAAWLQGKIGPKEEFYFDVHLFDLQERVLSAFVLTFARLLREGIGPGRGKADLRSVELMELSEDAGTGRAGTQFFDGSNFFVVDKPPVQVSLLPCTESITRCLVKFVTPTEFKSEQGLTSEPEFGVLFRRLRDRVSTLRALYGAGPLEIDFRGMGERAAAVKMVRSEIEHSDGERRSGRTGRLHGIGGIVGTVEYEGDLREFLPFLELGRWVGVGRHTVWGNGEIAVDQLSIG